MQGTGSKRARASISALAGLAMGGLLLPLAGCGGAATIDHHGHVFTDVDTSLVRPGMTKEDVELTLGSPDTTGTIDGDSYYYISSTQKQVAFLKPWEIDRQVIAVYFNSNERVRDVSHYGMKDGIVVDFAKDESPARGKDASMVQELFGNVAQRGMFKKQHENSATPGPGL
ncbi:outer membrane protein assembly factor BamE [Methyloligella halotolerans]|uniref:outer membrane protein assembly factor BamE n=1 Tax=Methyloligella halotolerans TaxID=1177755 RepID=UPI001470FB09|nr:outer membrane protein assembly factor BamE [Methyloligella halotolerans]